jgi:hypothetical protein
MKIDLTKLPECQEGPDALKHFLDTSEPASRVVTMWWGKQERTARQARNKFIRGKILTDALTAMKEARKT